MLRKLSRSHGACPRGVSHKMKKLISSTFTAILSTASNNPEETFIERKHHE